MLQLRGSKLEQFLEYHCSLFSLNDIFVTIDSNIFVLNIHALPGFDSMNASNSIDHPKSELQELLSEGKAKKRKFGPAKHDSDNSASKL